MFLNDKLRPWLINCIAYGIIAVGVIVFAEHIYSNAAEYDFLKQINTRDMFIAGTLVIVGYLLNSYQLWLFLGHFGVSLSFTEVTALAVTMILGNLTLPMRGGSGALAVYLKTVHKLDFQSFAVIYGGTAILITLINSGPALVALIYLYFTEDFFNGALFTIVTVMLITCIYLSVFPPPFKNRNNRIIGFIVNVANSWRLLTKNRKLLTKLAVSLILTTIVLTFTFHYIYRSIGANAPFSGVLLVSSLGTIANLVPFTPGSFGFVEAVTIQVPQLFGIDFVKSMSSAAIFRILNVILSISLGIPSAIYLLRRHGRAGEILEQEPVSVQSRPD